ncbi:hypothetical protein IAR55_001396 [Kwoniella newhampshirensis]|uniref:Endoplasmic reticulum transmembrane protein n=1 Tax=Kwoniella newhampshirensis TaxID=1651941 RepID=A0AAW0Z263_9TREE
MSILLAALCLIKHIMDTYFIFIIVSFFMAIYMTCKRLAKNTRKSARTPTVRPDGTISLADWVCDEIERQLTDLDEEVERRLDKRMKPLLKGLEKDKERVEAERRKLEKAKLQYQVPQNHMKDLRDELRMTKQANRELQHLIEWYKASLVQWEVTGKGPQLREVIFEPVSTNSTIASPPPTYYTDSSVSEPVSTVGSRSGSGSVSSRSRSSSSEAGTSNCHPSTSSSLGVDKMAMNSLE